MKLTLARAFTLLFATAVSLSALDGCTSKREESKYQQFGRVSLAVKLGADTHDVTAIQFKIVGVEDTCDGKAIAEAVVPIEQEALPTGQLPPGSGPQHAFADSFFILPPGSYRACATPMGAQGEPSRSCGRAEAVASVMPEMTTEVLLVSQCQGNPTGGLDVIGTLNDPPQITGLSIQDSKFITTCEKATITVVATDPNGDAVSFSWSVVSGPGGGTLTSMGASATFEGAAGDYEIKVTATDSLGGTASVTFPIHVSAGDCIRTSGVTLCDQDWGMFIMPPDGANPAGICGVPADPTLSHWFDFDSGQKVAPKDPRADLSKGHADCCSWNLWNGATQVDTGMPAGDVAMVTCGPMDGRMYSPAPVPYFQPNATVICLRTAAGRYVKYTTRSSCCGGITFDWAVAF